MTTYLERYVPLPEGEELEISVDYTKGTAYNFWDGQPRLRGLKIRVTPVRRSQGDGYISKTFRLGDDRGRAFHVVDLGRKSDKQGKRLAAFVDSNFDRIAELAREQNWGSLAALLWTYK